MFGRHLITAKHLKTTKDYKTTTFGVNDEDTAKPLAYCCDKCHKAYKHHSSLWKHRKSCGQSNELIVSSNDNQSSDKDIIMKLINDNQEFKSIIMDQSKTLQELASKVGTNGNNNHNNINSHNKTFNLNVFLNETCKDAMNISDFVSSIKMDLDDLETTARIGYAGGISGIFSHNLKDMDTRMRPIHCADLKREILYIKENGVWERDSTLLIRAIKAVALGNIRQINEWKKLYPDCTDSESRKNDLYLQIVSNSMCGIDKEETEKNLAKIVSNVAKQVVIVKQ